MIMTETKTIEVAIYPNGRVIPIIRERGMWRWDLYSASSHKDAAKANAIREGARIERRPNPNYRAPKLPTWAKLTKGL
jgi:hypothetical protein